MALDTSVPIDGDGVTTGVRVSELADSIRDLRTDLNAGGLDTLYAVSFATTWIARSDWTNVHMGSSTTKDADSNINHGLNAPLSDLLMKVLISTDGTDANSFELVDMTHIVDGSGEIVRGVIIDQVDSNNLIIQTGVNGITSIAADGTANAIVSDDWFYKIKAWKLG